MEHIVFYIIILVLSVVIHEVAHGYAAQALGDPTAELQGRLTLNPLSHIDPVGSVLLPFLLVFSGSGFVFGWAKPVPYNPYNLKNQRWGEAIVAGAGPLVNALIAVLFGLFLRLYGGMLSEPATYIVTLIILTNMALALLNLLPLPPLDGAKILKSLLPYSLRSGFDRFEMLIAQYGFIAMFGVLLVLVYVFSPYLGTAISALFSLLTGLDLSAALQ